MFRQKAEEVADKVEETVFESRPVEAVPDKVVEKSKNPPSNQGQSRQYRIKSSKKLKRLLIKSKNPQPMIRRSKKEKFFVKVLKQKLKQRLKQKQKKRLD